MTGAQNDADSKEKKNWFNIMLLKSQPIKGRKLKQGANIHLLSGERFDFPVPDPLLITYSILK